MNLQLAIESATSGKNSGWTRGQARRDLSLSTTDVSMIEEALNKVFGLENIIKDVQKQTATTAATAFHDYENYLKAIFRPGDTLCFVGIVHNEDKNKEQIENEFVSFETALSREYFDDLSVSNEHASIYVAMNTYPAQLIGQKLGRTQENVVDVRAVQADIDNAAAQTVAAMQSSAKVPPPSIVVESSTGKRQGIWLVDGIAKPEAKPLMQAIAAEFKTDSAVAEVARVMRVPGFVNRKYDSAPMAHTLVQTNKRYRREDFKVHSAAASASVQHVASEGYLNAPFIRKGGPYGGIYNHVLKIVGHYVDTIKDGDVMFDIVNGLQQRNGCFYPDGVTKYEWNEDQVRQQCAKLVNEWKDQPSGTWLKVSTAQQQPAEKPIPIVEDESDNDPRFDMTGETFDTSVYEKLAERSTPYPVPSDNDLVSISAKMLVHGTSIPLAYVREPLKAIVLHALDGKLVHPAFPKLSLRGNYFSLGESEGGKTTGLQYALDFADAVLKASQTHSENLFRYKSETTFIRSFTPEGTLKRDAHGNIKSGRPGHPSQFLYIKEGNLVANSSDYFAAVFSQLTNLYDQTEVGTESMTNGDFTANVVKTSTIMCFTPSDHKDTFGGKGNIGGGGLNRWGLVNPPAIHDYDDKDWQRFSDEVLALQSAELTRHVFGLMKGDRVTLEEEPEATQIRLEVKVMLKRVGAAGKRLMDYFMREQVVMAATSTDGRLVMTGKQARYAKAWVEAQVQCRFTSWPSDAANQIEQMEHAIRKAVNTHHVSETKLKDACHFYRPGSGGWFVYKTALGNAGDSGAIKWTGKTRKGVKTFCPGSCAVHPEIKEEKPSKPKN